MNRFTNNRILNSAVGSTSSGTLLSGECKRIIVTSNQNAYIKFNEDTAVANTTGFYIPKDTPITFDLVMVARVEAIRDTDDGRLTIVELF